MISSSRVLRLSSLLALALSSSAFSPAHHWGSRTPQGAAVSRASTRTTTALDAVIDIDNEASFDATIANAGSLVVIDYSTTWCGPCKVIAPKFDELSEKYPDAVFVKVIGDASPEASKLMKREGVRSVPSFHYFVGGQKVDVVNGANAEAIEAAIASHVSAKA